MKPRVFLVVLAGLLLAADTPSAQDGAAELDQLRGEWRLVSTADEKRTDEGSDQFTMSIQGGGKVVLKVGELTTNHGSLTLSLSGMVRGMDLKLANGKSVLGVYERHGDELAICFDDAANGRPAGMAPKGTQWLEKWKRTP